MQSASGPGLVKYSTFIEVMSYLNRFLCLAFCFLSALDYRSIVGSMADKATDYFTDSHDYDYDLTTITWEHAVNSKAHLYEALRGPKSMIEADVVLGHVEGDHGGILLPIMSHPPITVSDLSLVEFLSIYRNSSSIQGIKLDFKSRQAFSASENILVDALLKQPDMTLWLNADILPGPVNATTKPVDPDYFLSVCVSKFPQATLSVGWTTRYGDGIVSGSYSPDYIANMTEALNRNMVLQPVTFAVRAGLAAQSYGPLCDLIGSSVPGTTLTIWCSSDKDQVDIKDLKRLVNDIGRDKIYLDLPEEMTRQVLSSAPVSKIVLPLVLGLLGLLNIF